jgi:acyl-CoA reductase-like NAD-dependent aldehyde dehydrogenase
MPRRSMEIECGCVHVNSATVQNKAQPVCGGMKDSGDGHFDGRTVIDELRNVSMTLLHVGSRIY